MKPLRVLILEEEGQLVAQCLDYDIVTQASDLETLQRRLVDTIWLEGAAGLDRIGPAPEAMQILWTGGI